MDMHVPCRYAGRTGNIVHKNRILKSWRRTCREGEEVPVWEGAEEEEGSDSRNEFRQQGPAELPIRLSEDDLSMVDMKVRTGSQRRQQARTEGTAIE